MSATSELTWLAVDPPPPRRTVPCQLFDECLAPAGELLADGRMHRVPSGHLLVTVARPGQEAIDRFVHLEPGGRYLLRFFRPPRNLSQQSSPAAGTRVRLQRQAGLGRYEPTGSVVLPSHAAASLKVAVPQRDIIVAELAGVGAARVRVSLPPAREGAGIRLTRAMSVSLEAGEVGRVVLEDDDLLRALNFLHAGQLREARQLVGPLVRALEIWAPRDPVGAVVVGYVLLATHELHPSASWCVDLPAAEPWLPDALVIAAEWFATAGYHLTASAYLRQLAEVGLPLFTYGYQRAVSRLRLYESDPLSAKPRERSAVDMDASLFKDDARYTRAQELPPWERSACGRTLAALARWSPSVDRSAPTLTVRWDSSDKSASSVYGLEYSRPWLFGLRRLAKRTRP